MTESEIPKRTSASQTIITTACLLLILAGLKFAAPIIVPFILAVFLAIISTRPLKALEKKGVPPLVAFFIVIAVDLVLTVGFILIIEIALRNFLYGLPEFEQQIQEKRTVIMNLLHRVGLGEENKRLIDLLDRREIVGLGSTLLSGLSKMIGYAFIVYIMVVFLLLEASTLQGKFRKTLRSPDESIAAIRKFVEKLQHYLTIKTYISFATGLSIAVWLFIIGADFYLFMGLLAFLLNYIPSIGSLIAAVPAVLITFISYGFGKTVLVLIGYITVNIIFGNLVEPKVMGKGLGLSPFVVFLSLILWGWLFGPVGMLLAVPLTMLLKHACEHNQETKWLAVFIGSESSDDNSKDAS